MLGVGIIVGDIFLIENELLVSLTASERRAWVGCG
jgi:hypothetical protein